MRGTPITGCVVVVVVVLVPLDEPEDEPELLDGSVPEVPWVVVGSVVLAEFGLVNVIALSALTGLESTTTSTRWEGPPSSKNPTIWPRKTLPPVVMNGCNSFIVANGTIPWEYSQVSYCCSGCCPVNSGSRFETI